MAVCNFLKEVFNILHAGAFRGSIMLPIINAVLFSGMILQEGLGGEDAIFFQLPNP